MNQQLDLNSQGSLRHQNWFLGKFSTQIWKFPDRWSSTVSLNCTVMQDYPAGRDNLSLYSGQLMKATKLSSPTHPCPLLHTSSNAFENNHEYLRCESIHHVQKPPQYYFSGCPETSNATYQSGHSQCDDLHHLRWLYKQNNPSEQWQKIQQIKQQHTELKILQRDFQKLDKAKNAISTTSKRF